MRKILLLFFLVFFFSNCQGASSQKYLIILQAGAETHEGMARAVHALLYAQELKEAGYEVALVFDGAGTEWAKALLDPKNKLHPAYTKLQDLGVTEIICDFCAKAFHVKQDLKGGKVPLVAEFHGHPSLVKWLQKGYLPIIL